MALIVASTKIDTHAAQPSKCMSKVHFSGINIGEQMLLAPIIYFSLFLLLTLRNKNFFSGVSEMIIINYYYVSPFYYHRHIIVPYHLL